jgi:ABC-type Na+ efflux pump permease subunit
MDSSVLSLLLTEAKNSGKEILRGISNPFSIDVSKDAILMQRIQERATKQKKSTTKTNTTKINDNENTNESKNETTTTSTKTTQPPKIQAVIIVYLIAVLFLIFLSFFYFGVSISTLYQRLVFGLVGVIGVKSITSIPYFI